MPSPIECCYKFTDDFSQHFLHQHHAHPGSEPARGRSCTQELPRLSLGGAPLSSRIFPAKKTSIYRFYKGLWCSHLKNIHCPRDCLRDFPFSYVLLYQLVVSKNYQMCCRWYPVPVEMIPSIVFSYGVLGCSRSESGALQARTRDFRAPALGAVDSSGDPWRIHHPGIHVWYRLGNRAIRVVVVVCCGCCCVFAVAVAVAVGGGGDFGGGSGSAVMVILCSWHATRNHCCLPW